MNRSVLALIMLVGCGGASPVASAPPTASSPRVEAAGPISPSVPPAPPMDPATMPKQKAMLLRAARYFDGRGDAVVDGGVAVLVENGLITKVGKAGAVAAPSDAETIDLGDATLLPGFIDAHAHVSLDYIADYYKFYYDLVRRPATEWALHAASNATKTLMAGFTTIRDLNSWDFIDVGVRNAIAADLVPGPRMLVSVHAIGSTGGHKDLGALPDRLLFPITTLEGFCDSPEACVKAVRDQVKYGADVIKVMASGGVLSPVDAVDSSQIPKETLEAIVGEAHRLGKKVAAHCHGDLAAKMAIDAGVDSIEHGSFLKPDTLAMMKRHGTALVPTLLATEWLSTRDNAKNLPPQVQAKLKQAMSARSQMFKDALRIGVVIGFGTDSGCFPHGMNAREFSLMTSLGMSPAAALRSATSVDAELLGIANQTGTLEAGKLADIVAVPGNPLVDIKQTENVVFVMRAGRVYKSAGK